MYQQVRKKPFAGPIWSTSRSFGTIYAHWGVIGVLSPSWVSKLDNLCATQVPFYSPPCQLPSQPLSKLSPPLTKRRFYPLSATGIVLPPLANYHFIPLQTAILHPPPPPRQCEIFLAMNLSSTSCPCRTGPFTWGKHRNHT